MPEHDPDEDRVELLTFDGGERFLRIYDACSQRTTTLPMRGAEFEFDPPASLLNQLSYASLRVRTGVFTYQFDGDIAERISRLLDEKLWQSCDFCRSPAACRADGCHYAEARDDVDGTLDLNEKNGQPSDFTG